MCVKRKRGQSETVQRGEAPYTDCPRWRRVWGQGGLSLYSCAMCWLCALYVLRLPCVREPFGDKPANDERVGIQTDCCPGAMCGEGVVTGRSRWAAASEVAQVGVQEGVCGSSSQASSHQCRGAGWAQNLQDREEPTQAPGVLGHIQDAVQPSICREPWHPRRYPLFLRSSACRHHGRGPTQLPGEETSDPGVEAMLAIYWSHDQRLPSATGTWWKAAEAQHSLSRAAHHQHLGPVLLESLVVLLYGLDQGPSSLLDPPSSPAWLRCLSPTTLHPG